MKTKVRSPKPPRRLYSKRDTGEFIENDIWFCGECYCLTAGHHTEATAADCCRISLCACGKEIEPYYQSKCRSCSDQERWAKEQAAFDALEVVVYQDESIYHNDRYYINMEDLLETIADDPETEWPALVQICETEPLCAKLSSDDIVSHAIEQLTEDFEEPDSVTIEGEDEFRKACQDFIAKQTYTTWHPMNKKVVVPWIELGKETTS